MFHDLNSRHPVIKKFKYHVIKFTKISRWACIIYVNLIYHELILLLAEILFELTIFLILLCVSSCSGSVCPIFREFWCIFCFFFFLYKGLGRDSSISGPARKQDYGNAKQGIQGVSKHLEINYWVTFHIPINPNFKLICTKKKRIQHLHLMTWLG